MSLELKRSISASSGFAVKSHETQSEQHSTGLDNSSSKTSASREIKSGVETALIAPDTQQKSDNPAKAFWLGNSLKDEICQFKCLNIIG